MNIIGVFLIYLPASIIGGPTSELPAECAEYLILDHPTRNIHHGAEVYSDAENNCISYVTSPDWQGGNYWYRMLPPAGVVIPQTSLEAWA